MWSVVVITTADEAQRQAFEQQIKDKYERRELPMDLPILVVADPPGPSRIGNGGSTLTALEFLHNQYGKDLFHLKVLLIHAGGWSQRMPSATILGKIFSPIPYGEPVYQMLDLKLAMYLPFVPRLSPGVFLVCADDFLVYDLRLGESGDWSIPADGFTAFAHPSPISIGRTHGVYVVDRAEELDTKSPVVLAECLEVLQKPSDQLMRDKGALLSSSNGQFEFANGITLKGEVVYTDSSFYFGVDVMKRLLELKKEIGQITCEIDAYGDFLQALGPRATGDYIHNTSNISLKTSNLINVRQQVYQAMRPCHIQLLLLNASQFIHIGTTKELIHHFCADEQFKAQMLLHSDVFNSWLQLPDHPASQEEKFVETSWTDDLQAANKRKGCVMHSVLVKSSSLAKNAVVEYCRFDVPVSVEEDTIISSCQWLKEESGKGLQGQDVLHFPGGTFLHTVSVLHQGKSVFVTVFSSISDDLKVSAPIASLSSLAFFRTTVGHAMRSWTVPEKVVAPKADDRSEVMVSLWTLKLYPGAVTMTESLELALDMICSLQERCALPKSLALDNLQFFSLSDVLTQKDVTTMLNFRRQLFDQIQLCRVESKV